MPDDQFLSPLAAGLAGRMRALVTALDRLDRLESGTGQWRQAFDEAELPEAATALALRALATAGDAVNFALLRRLVAADSLALPALMTASGLGRLALSERLNDLVQVGLATRAIDTDHVQATAAGAAMVELVHALGDQVAARFQAAVGDTGRAGGAREADR